MFLHLIPGTFLFQWDGLSNPFHGEGNPSKSLGLMKGHDFHPLSSHMPIAMPLTLLGQQELKPWHLGLISPKCKCRAYLLGFEFPLCFWRLKISIIPFKIRYIDDRYDILQRICVLEAWRVYFIPSCHSARTRCLKYFCSQLSSLILYTSNLCQVKLGICITI